MPALRWSYQPPTPPRPAAPPTPPAPPAPAEASAPVAPVKPMPVHIETNGYVLRSLRPQDATPRFTHWLNADEMLDGLNLPRLDFDAHALAAFITRFDDLHSHFIGIFDKSNGLLVGFYTLDVNTVHGVASITAGIGELEYRGQRVFWKTIDALLDHFFLYRDVDKITARVLARNRSMLFNFIDNPRFVYEAILRQECRAPDRTRLDLLVFAAFPDRPGRVGGS